MNKKVILDFDNELALLDLPEINGRILCEGIDRLEIINSLGPLNEDDYMDLCKCSIFGIDFQNNTITIYKATSLSQDTVYNEALLQEKRSFACKDLQNHYYALLTVLTQ